MAHWQLLVSKAEYVSVLLLFRLLISFLLRCFTDFLSTMALLEVSEANCTAIDTAITIWTDGISLHIKNR